MKFIQFIYSMREKYYPELPSSPHMDLESVLYLRNQLEKSDTFIEFGSGGSTIFAAKLNVPVIFSVESDELWMQRVQRKILRMKSTSQIHFVRAQVGKVGPWGTPLELVDGERMYANAPWGQLNVSTSGNFILIDGRFRVTCFLVSLLRSPDGTEILFDDYYDRDSYQIVEKILEPDMRVGRSAVFTRPKVVDELAIQSMIDAFKFDSD
jgi:hypothetical protein